MVEKAKIFYFTVFILVVIAFIFHVTAMGHHHWKKATNNYNNATNYNYIGVGLFTRCSPMDNMTTEICFPNKFPMSDNCYDWTTCLFQNPNETCQCDYTPSTKGIAACAIIASIFLGLAIIILFIHSINTSETRSIGLILGFFPLLLLLLAFIFILITLILVGCYLSRDIMHFVRAEPGFDLGLLRQRASERYTTRVDWASGLEIISLVLTFFSFVLYSIFVFKIGRSS